MSIKSKGKAQSGSPFDGSGYLAIAARNAKTYLDELIAALKENDKPAAMVAVQSAINELTTAKASVPIGGE